MFRLYSLYIYSKWSCPPKEKSLLHANVTQAAVFRFTDWLTYFFIFKDQIQLINIWPAPEQQPVRVGGQAAGVLGLPCPWAAQVHNEGVAMLE